MPALRIGPHRVMLGDSHNVEDVTALFGEDRAALVLSDSPWDLPGAFEPYVLGPAHMRYMEPRQGHWIGSPLPHLCETIGRLTGPGDIVADPYLGSGTTLLACDQTGRRCYGMEIDKGRFAELVARLGA